MSIIQAKSSQGSWCVDLILLTVGIAFVFGLFLGTRPLSVPDEGRYAEIPREMCVLHDFVTPHLNGVNYFEKPPLFYWLQAGAIKVFNPLILSTEQAWNPSKRNRYWPPISEWTVRLPNAIAALLACLFVYASGRILFERRAGLLSAVILASSLLFFALARMVTLDMTLSTCLSGSLFAFLLAANQPPSVSRRCLFYSAYLFAGLAVLTKGLIGILFPSMIIGLWMLLSRQGYLFKQSYLPSGVLLFLLLVLPWHLLVQARNPEFFQFYFVDQQFLRYSTLIAQRYQPSWYFIPIFIVGFLPWVCFLPQAIWSLFSSNGKSFKEKNNYIFLLLWVGIIFLFFSFSHSKLIPYILPIFPALALLTGHYLSTHWQQCRKTQWGYIAVPLAWLGLGGVGVLCLINDASIKLSHNASLCLITSYSLFLLISIAASFWAVRKKSSRAFASLALGSVLSFMIISVNIPQLDTRSIKPLVAVLGPLVKSNDKIVAYHDYYQDLPFYLNQRVFTVHVEGEFMFGMQHQDTHDWMLQEAYFWSQWNSAQRIYMLASNTVYEQINKQKKYRIYLLGKTPHDVLLSNHPIKEKKITIINDNED